MDYRQDYTETGGGKEESSKAGFTDKPELIFKRTLYERERDKRLQLILLPFYICGMAFAVYAIARSGEIINNEKTGLLIIVGLVVMTISIELMIGISRLEKRMKENKEKEDEQTGSSK